MQLFDLLLKIQHDTSWQNLIYLMFTSVFLLFFLGETLNAVLNFRNAPGGENDTELEQVTPTAERNM